MDISAEIAAIQAASQGAELRQPLVGALNKLNSGTLPAVTSSDAGKILKVGANGWEVGEKSGYMPVPSASLSITSNNTYDVTNYSEAVVNVSGGGGSILISKTITQNGTYDPANDNADGYSEVIVDVQSGSSGVYFGVEDPSNSLGSNGEYYYKRTNTVNAISNISSSISGSNTTVYGIEFYVTENLSISKLMGYVTENRTGKIRIGTTSDIIAEKNVNFLANQWVEATLDNLITLTANQHYIIQIVIDSGQGAGKIGYVSHVGSITYRSNIKYVQSRYGSFPGTVESNSGILVDFGIYTGIWNVTKQYYKQNDVWSPIT